MDPLSIGTAASSLVVAIFQASQYVHEFVNNAKVVDSRVDQLGAGIDSLLAILQAIKAIFDSSSAQKALKGATDVTALMASVQASIDDCMATAQEIRQIFENIQKEKTDSRSFLAKALRQLKLNSKQDALDTMNARVLVHKTNMQLSLQTINVFVAYTGPERVTDVLSPKMEELRRMVKDLQLDRLDRTDSFDVRLIQHTETLQASAQHLISRQSTLVATDDEDWMRISRRGTGASKYSASSITDKPSVYLVNAPRGQEPDSENELDSDEELETNLSINLLRGGIELYIQGRYVEAEPTLKNSIQDALRKKLRPDHQAKMKRAQLSLGVCRLHLEKFDESEPVLRGIAELPRENDDDTLLASEALYYLSQVSLARHDFTAALRDCQQASREIKKILGKQNPSFVDTIVLLALIYGTSGDRFSADTYLNRVPSNMRNRRDNIAVLKFTCEGMNLSFSTEQSTLKLLFNALGRNDDYSGEALRWSAVNGHLNAVKLLLYNGAPIEASTSIGATALSFAAGNGHTAIVQLLIEKGATVHLKSLGTSSPLHDAALHDHVDVCRLLLDAGATPDGDVRSGWGVLMCAALKGNNKTLRLLLDRGASPEVKNTDYNRTALMYAARERHPETVQMLLQAGADPNRVDREGQTALIFAVESGILKSVQHLLKSGAKVEKPEGLEGYAPTPLTVAAENGNVDVVRLLLDQGAEIDAPGRAGRAPVWYAAGYERQLEVLKVLLENGARIEDAVPDRGKEQTALYHAIDGSNEEGARMLIEAGADVNEASYDVCTPLFMANARGLPGIEKLLKERGALLDWLIAGKG